jgi:hypothetical protein
LQALAAAYVEALEGQVNDGKSGEWVSFMSSNASEHSLRI